MWISELLPNLKKSVDDLTIIRSMHTEAINHEPAITLMQSGNQITGRPCLGSWISYGLGSLNDNLPTFVVLPDRRGLPYNNGGNFTSAFLPVTHQGTIIKANAPVPIADLFPPESAREITPAAEADGRAL